MLGGGVGLTLQTDSFEVEVIASYDYHKTNSGLNSLSNQTYALQSYTANFKWQLPKRISLETEAVYYINSQRTNGYNLQYLIWDASINKTFLKNDNLIVSVNCNDILNKNISVNRSTQDNVVTNTKTNIIERYLLLNAVLKFNNI